jgi:serine acetyltransferase
VPADTTAVGVPARVVHAPAKKRKPRGRRSGGR